jgi:ferredoxin
MANARRRLAINAPGALFVDATCIDCDTCRQIAPEVFERSVRDARSFVAQQPRDAAAQLSAGKAVIACPTSSIGSEEKLDLTMAARAFPEHIADGVHYCGYTSADSFGASSYLIVRPSGNVLVDSPRAAAPLFARIAELGGVRTMFLTHRDDVADHARVRARFGCERVIHQRT